MSITPKNFNEWGSYAHGVRYIDFCRYAREYEPTWDAVRTNKAWSDFTKASL